MANFKRKRSRKQVRCTLCTPHRWKGNKAGPSGDGRFKFRDHAKIAAMEKEVEEYDREHGNAPVAQG